MKRLSFIFQYFIFFGICFSNVNSSESGTYIEVETYQHDVKTLKALIALPEGDGPFPVIMLIHGGGFNFGNRERFDKSLFEHYLTLGFALMSVEYRLVSEGGAHPVAINDCMHNLHWLIDHADTYGFDTNRIVLQGSSAGSYLTMMLALTSEDTLYQPDFGPYQNRKASVKAVVSCAAMYDWAAIDAGEGYIGAYRNEPTVSPVTLTQLGSCPYFLLLGGDGDMKWSPPNSAKLMQSKLITGGKVCELHLKSDTKHPSLYHDYKIFPQWALPRIDAFLKKYVLAGDQM